MFATAVPGQQGLSAERIAQAAPRGLRSPPEAAGDRLDLYLLHWRESAPLDETIEAMEALTRAGKIRHWGVSNLDTSDMQELVSAGGADCVTDQILYNLSRRGPEHDLLPWLQDNAMPVMAYSPVEQGRLVADPTLAAWQTLSARRRRRSPWHGRCAAKE